MLAEDEVVCPSCGNLREVCSDPNRNWYPQKVTCYASADRELTMRRLQAKYKAEPGTRSLHPFDGVSVWMSEHDFQPDETFFDSASQQSPGQQGQPNDS